ncbi:MAG: MFS transporter, partial [Pantoea sp.]|nr:MFS transporter [Pantoea sp.]
VLFGMSQNLGGLIGSAILGTFQTWREKYHSSLLSDQLSLLDPNVNERLSQYNALFNSLVGDNILLGAQSSSQLQTVATLQANVLAYNDTYLLTAALALITLMWVIWRLTRRRYLDWRQAQFNLREQHQLAALQENTEKQ